MVWPRKVQDGIGECGADQSFIVIRLTGEQNVEVEASFFRIPQNSKCGHVMGTVLTAGLRSSCASLFQGA